ncbi:hypothetical protein MNBD_GAMMA24-2036 [hydrothermal vent metagenome]|uniref:Uncharacterized protein n=1 Tax=hydrothermal vent metagenome TaxID=652676 RepID=A0A3B1C7X9_9ZZZZ
MYPVFTRLYNGGIILLLATLLLAACTSAPEKKMPQEKLTPSKLVDNKIKREFKQALVLMQANKLPQAAEKFHDLIERYPQMTGAWANLGLLHMKAGEWKKAQYALQQALSLNSNLAPAYNYLGVVNRNLGLFRQAEQAYKKAINADPAYASAWLNLGILYDIYMNQPAQALPQYEQYQHLKNNADNKVHKWIVELKRRLPKQPTSSRTTGNHHNG